MMTQIIQIKIVNDKSKYRPNEDKARRHIILIVIFVYHGCHDSVYYRNDHWEDRCQVVEALGVCQVFFFVGVEIGDQEEQGLEVEGPHDWTYAVSVGIEDDKEDEESEEGLD